MHCIAYQLYPLRFRLNGLVCGESFGDVRVAEHAGKIDEVLAGNVTNLALLENVAVEE
jgi:hypothetical protein